MVYVVIGILVVVVIAGGALLLRRNAASPYHGESDAGGSSPMGDTTEHSDVSSAPRTSRRG